MDANDFVTWLHGFVEACGETLTPEQCKTLRDKVALFTGEKRDMVVHGPLGPIRLRIRQDEADKEQEQGTDMRESIDTFYKKIARKEGPPVVPTWGTVGVHKGEYVYVGGHHWWLVDGDAQDGEKR